MVQPISPLRMSMNSHCRLFSCEIFFIVIFLILFSAAKLRRIRNRNLTINSDCIAQSSYKHNIGHKTRIKDTNIIKLNDKILSSLKLFPSLFWVFRPNSSTGRHNHLSHRAKRMCLHCMTCGQQKQGSCQWLCL